MGEDDLSQLPSDIQDSLDDIGYTDVSDLDKVVSDGVLNPIFTKLVVYLAREVSSLSDLEDQLQEADCCSEAWMMELSSLLRELGCPHVSLTEGPVSDRLNSKRSRLVLLDFLLSELMAARMIAENQSDKNLRIQLQESPTAAALKRMLLALGFPKPPDNITPLQLWDKVAAKVTEITSKAPPALVGKPLMSKTCLTGDQWKLVETVVNGLEADYSLRRKMLLTRLDATIQSFTWSDRMKGREGEIGEMYRVRRSALTDKPVIGVADLMSAREDAAIVEKVSSSQSRQNTRTSLNKVLIGAVPDRGGRTETMQAPPPEMPSWQQRQPDQGRGGGRGGHGRGGGRGRDFSPKGQRGGYQGQGGGYQGQSGGYQGQSGGYQGQGGGYQGQGGGYQGQGGGYQGQGGHHSNGGGGGYKGGRGSGRVQGAGWSGGGGGGGGGYSRGRNDNRRQR